MSAETLRRAAAVMRDDHGPNHPRHATWHAIAAWLDAEAALRPTETRQAVDPAWSHALVIARAYLDVTP